MRAGSAIALLVAIVFGGLAAFLSREFLLGLATPAPAPKASTMVVASQPLEFGANLTGDNLREIQWPGDPLEGSFKTVAELLKDGRRLTLVSMQRNEPILASKITGPNQRATLSTLIEEGMRAVSVNVDEVRGVAGFILPGDRVDVVLTRGDRGMSSESGPVADVLLQNVKVLAIDQVANERTDKPTLAKAVTLELDIQQSQKVILAQGVGRLSLVLRQAGEASSADARRVTMADLGLSETIAPKKEDGKDDERFAKLEARLEEMRKAAAAPLPPSPIATLAKPDDRVIVNVIRGASKRDEYTVLTETR
ncbi:Flp pilus assembly protein CpaB [Microvirga sp. G4-2]|uniref:Flp pilus assembly protein CpaB n=1 Tax=Microvirga sp. G4-2 TaxID=3434467 RepID=UPI004043BCB8